MWPSFTSGASAPVQIELATNKVNVFVVDYADGSTLYAEATITMPSDWNAGTITAQFHWTNANSNTQVCRWQIEGRASGTSDNLDTAFGTPQAVDDANVASATNKLLISDATPAVTISGAGASKQVQFRIARLGGHANDTLTSDARLLGVVIIYTRS